jgi:hypothetical protein
MKFVPGELYHIHNQGNNKQRIFFTPNNYSYFLAKLRKHVLPFCDLLAYCLLPTDFRLMVHASASSVIKVKCGAVKMNSLANGFRILESSYARGINKQENRTGSIFQQNTKCEILTSNHESMNSEFTPYGCFQSIHQAPVVSGLTRKIENWEFSSLNEYLGYTKLSICNKSLAFELLNLSVDTNSPEQPYH